MVYRGRFGADPEKRAKMSFLERFVWDGPHLLAPENCQPQAGPFSHCPEDNPVHHMFVADIEADTNKDAQGYPLGPGQPKEHICAA